MSHTHLHSEKMPYLPGRPDNTLRHMLWSAALFALLVLALLKG